MTLVAMIRGTEHWVARAMNGATEVFADASLPMVEAKMVVARYLDAALGRNGWKFAN